MKKINIAKENGYDHVINYNKEDFAKKVLEITDGKGVPVVYDGVGKDTLDGSIECLAVRGMMVSFGNASGPLSDINVPKMLQPKGLYLVRPAMQQYLSTKEELDEASKIMFEKISSGKVKINIFKKYKLDQVIQAHKDLEGRKILGPAVITSLIKLYIHIRHMQFKSICRNMNFSNKKSIEIIIDKQQDPKINLAIKTSFKYRPNTVSILNKKTKCCKHDCPT